MSLMLATGSTAGLDAGMGVLVGATWQGQPLLPPSFLTCKLLEE